MRRIVIVSTGRTATRSIAAHLASTTPDVSAIHITPRSTLMNILSNAWLCRMMPTFVLDATWKLLKAEHWAPANDRPIFVDSNNHLYAWSRRLMEQYPDLHMIHVVRDPRSYVQSHMRWSQLRTKSLVANYLLPFWQPNPLLLGDTDISEWWQMSRFSRFCWIWDFKNRYMSETGRRFPDRYLCVFFEDLISPERSARAIRQIEEFIGIENTSEQPFSELPHMNKTTSGCETAWHNLSDEQCKTLEHFCGRQMREYGYGNEASWLSRIS